MNATHLSLLTLALFPIILGGCFASVTYQGGELGGTVGGTIDPGTVSGQTTGGTYEDGEIIQTGVASWYGGKFHGRETASGEIFDKWAMTAAHRTLPLGTRLVVERESNGKAVEVTVNDRGPYVKGRILDLSRGAAGKLDMVDDGTAQVRLYNVGGSTGSSDRTKIGGRDTDDPEETEDEPTGRFAIQVGSFENESNANALKSRLVDQFDDVRITFAYDQYYRVRVGSFRTEAEAEITEEELRERGFETWVVRND